MRTLALVSIIALMMFGCSEASPTTVQEPPRSPDALAGLVDSTSWTRADEGDVWEFSAQEVAIRDGSTGTWEAIDSNTIAVYLKSYYTITFNESLTAATLRGKDANQQMTRN